MRVLIAYASLHGSTEEIAAAVGATLGEAGFETDVRSAGIVTDVGRCRAVILGSALYGGAWLGPALDLARRHRTVLAAVPVWLFSSGPIGACSPEDREQPRERMDLDEWLLPEGHEVFPGRLDTARLSFGERMMARTLRAATGDHRDWGAIQHWAMCIADSLRPPTQENV